MRLVLALLFLLALPGTASTAELTLLLETDGGVRYGTPHEATGRLAEGEAPLAGQVVEIQSRLYPYRGEFRTIATATTGAGGEFAFERRFDRNVQLRALAPAQQAVAEPVTAHVYPRPRSTFEALDGRRLRITQILRTPAGVRLTAPTIFYLGPRNATSAPRVASARPERVGRGRFRATAIVRLPRAWRGNFRYGSCFRYSEGSGLGDPRASCPRRYLF